MTRHLDRDAWRHSIVSWLSVCAAAEGERAEADCLRSLRELLAVAPQDVIALIGAPANASEIEGLLAIGATETAAVRMVRSAPFGYLVSQAFGGPAACTVSVPGSGKEVSFSCYSGSLVRLGAVMKSVARIMSNGEIPGLPGSRATN